ncbi:MAG: TIGR00297 family protein, partial [Synechocystis sp.]|nr:TIGR00297 family protein [Synechocystis sp.]
MLETSTQFWNFNQHSPWLVALILNTALLAMAGIIPKKLLTFWGYLHAWVLGVIVWSGFGWQGYGVVLAYFLVGSAVTKIGQTEKEAAGIAEERSGRRGPENVWGSAFTAAVCALLTWVVPVAIVPWLALGYVASFSTKLSDTTASEVGKAYGKRTFLITTLQPVPRGTEGAVSLEGTLAGFWAGFALALLGWSVGMISGWGIVFCTIAAFIATNIESLIGATLQSQWQWLTNEVVNGINTLLG